MPKLSKSLKENNFSTNSMRKISNSLDDMRKDQRRKKALRDAFLTEMDDHELEEIFSVWARPESY